MTISVDALSWLIMSSTAMVILTPVILLVLWFKDKKGKNLW